jgi:hypothetical protein
MTPDHDCLRTARGSAADIAGLHWKTAAGQRPQAVDGRGMSKNVMEVTF